MMYQAFSCSVTGASHAKSGKPCQDYSLHYADKNVAIAVVADGHGSDAHFRSDRGARFACECAVKLIAAFAEKYGGNLGESELPELARCIACEWDKRVTEDWEEDPPGTLNKEQVSGDSENHEGSKNPKDLLDPREAYGSTLIAAAVTRSGWFGLQIGDGKCAVRYTDGDFMQPIPWDEKCFLNVTTSLCDTDPGSEFRFYASREIPAALFIGTDGVDNSYPVHENEKHLNGLYSIIADNFAREGFKKGLVELRDFLPILTQKGSGDDVSIAGIMRVNP
ncbi:PP2C family serine/threonine-protein phosphatase [Treponema primitia]|uniref:PP2C family serine/threonine-protein phosphatase n=1 Tax=Treponema primitia TaxID=88058 RepID=UPI0002555809|nr:PP2C family serine/threonine-protein phosphatase [Treponema primitia]